MEINSNTAINDAASDAFFLISGLILMSKKVISPIYVNNNQLIIHVSHVPTNLHDIALIICLLLCTSTLVFIITILKYFFDITSLVFISFKRILAA